MNIYDMIANKQKVNVLTIEYPSEDSFLALSFSRCVIEKRFGVLFILLRTIKDLSSIIESVQAVSGLHLQDIRSNFLGTYLLGFASTELILDFEVSFEKYLRGVSDAFMCVSLFNIDNIDLQNREDLE